MQGGSLGCRITTRLPRASGGIRRRTLVNVEVHSGQHSTSRMVAQTRSADALISVSIWQNVIKTLGYQSA
jgi:hypothetical protein